MVDEIVTARAHVVVRTPIATPILTVHSYDGIQGEVAGDLALKNPGIIAIGYTLDTRRICGIIARHSIQPDPGMLDNVVVDRDYLRVNWQHAGVLQSVETASGAR
jgi:hypothetical protein